MPTNPNYLLNLLMTEPTAASTHIGGENADIFVGDMSANRFYGGEGADVIAAGRGNDLILGGGGSDYISGNQGLDTLTGGEGADTFVMDGDFDQDVVTDFDPAAGDTLEFITYATHQTGWTGADILSFATQQADGVLITLPQSDERVALLGVHLSDLTAEMFSVISRIPADEHISMQDLGAVSLFDRSVVSGTTAADVIVANGASNIFGAGGNDRITGSDGNDILTGGQGNDTLDGGDGADLIDGGDGDDRIFGRRGADTLLGGDGNDSIDTGRDVTYVDGGSGDDVITVQMRGGADHLLTGGSGADSFEFFTFADSAASDLIITDFELGVDQLMFQRVDAWSYFAALGGIDIIDTTEGALLAFGANDTLLLTGVTATAFLAAYGNALPSGATFTPGPVLPVEDSLVASALLV